MRDPLEDRNGEPYPEIGEEEGFALTDEIDHEILMHRDAHFGGDFKVMLDYYSQDNIGVNPEFDYDRIIYLAEVEKELGQDLAPNLLSGPEAERVSRARRAYETLKEIYLNEEKEETPIPRLIADLILTEVEEPEEEIEAVVALGSRIVPELLHILVSEEAYDPIFPGYGYAPYMAIICLGKIGDPQAIVPLFETLGKEIVFEEEVVIEALAALGLPAREFLLKLLNSRPLTEDNTNAAWALSVFAEDPSVAIACFEQLKDPKVRERPLLRTYLLCNCEALKETSYREAFMRIAEDPNISPDMRLEIEHMIDNWR